jgi:hypothetical protein
MKFVESGKPWHFAKGEKNIKNNYGIRYKTWRCLPEPQASVISAIDRAVPFDCHNPLGSFSTPLRGEKRPAKLGGIARECHRLALKHR